MFWYQSAITRAEVTSDGVLRGYAAVYDQPTARQSDYPGTETIARGAFDSALGRDDVLALVDHDMGKLLGRTSTGTLRLSSDDHGLAFEEAPTLAREAMKQTRLLVNNPCEISEADAQRLYETAW